MAQAFYWSSFFFLNCRLHLWISLSSKTMCPFSLNDRGKLLKVYFGYPVRQCVNTVHSEQAEISQAAMITTLLLTFVKKERKKSYPFEEICMYRNTDKSKTGMHILYHMKKIDITSWEYLSCLWMHFLKTRRGFVCEFPLTFWLSYWSHVVWVVFSVPLLRLTESVLCSSSVCATRQSTTSSTQSKTSQIKEKRRTVNPCLNGPFSCISIFYFFILSVNEKGVFPFILSIKHKPNGSVI